jgi:hypothetical protein
MTGMIIGTAIVTTQLWQFRGEEMILPGLALIVFVVLLIVGARLMWGVLHPPRRPYVERDVRRVSADFVCCPFHRSLALRSSRLFGAAVR